MVFHCFLTSNAVAGEVDTIELLQGRNINDVIEAIKVQAIERAIRSGADASEYR